MPELRPVDYKDFEKFLFYIGCKFKRQKGSHRIYNRSDLIRPIVVPAVKDVSVLVIRSNLKTLQITVEKYLDILGKIL